MGVDASGLLLLAAMAGVWLWAVVDTVRTAMARPGLGEIGLVVAAVVGGPPVAFFYLVLRLTFWSERWERRQDRRRAARASRASAER
ncbi:hypothetical protein [Aeromicrobium sp. IC_218]|uniref:hypothetical protein n=1 Tax=Aeromicrobium sp. IC_218 TaxID=2545468 RepID=UPI00103D136A|nr:hypothetical protein [Aeromicrobium sp. IC_218]TCI97841.1 hypothetical protein E0W78_11060 [Aeromicrobium sp. IC_218]